jgi:hypothetical protein
MWRAFHRPRRTLRCGFAEIADRDLLLPKSDSVVLGANAKTEKIEAVRLERRGLVERTHRAIRIAFVLS